MPKAISDACISCGTCVPECPVDAISEDEPIYTIDQDTCTNCELCMPVCPTDAIYQN